MKSVAILMLMAAALGGCVGSNEVLFVTNTNAGVNFDSTPPNASIGYDRQEGYIGPAYANGALPPVVARFSSNLNLFSPEVRQVYATGAAAKQLADPNRKLGPELPLSSRSKQVAYFVTESSTGLRVTFSNSPIPQSVHFGYRRKEFSLLPIGTSQSGSCSGDTTGAVAAGPVDCYGSVLAKIDVGANVTTPGETGMKLSQFFATGQAANTLATNPDVVNLFKTSLGVPPLLEDNPQGNCDAACGQILTFLLKDPGKNPVTLRALCPTMPSKDPYVNFLYRPQWATDRAGCAARLPA